MSTGNFIAKELTTVTAWKYQLGKDFPAWVARRCHFLEDGKLTANTIVGPVPVDEGDYVTLFDEETHSVTVCKGVEFEAQFRPVEDRA